MSSEQLSPEAAPSHGKPSGGNRAVSHAFKAAAETKIEVLRRRSSDQLDTGELSTAANVSSRTSPSGANTKMAFLHTVSQAGGCRPAPSTDAPVRKTCHDLDFTKTVSQLLPEKKTGQFDPVIYDDEEVRSMDTISLQSKTESSPDASSPDSPSKGRADNLASVAAATSFLTLISLFIILIASPCVISNPNHPPRHKGGLFPDLLFASASEADHIYSEGDPLIVWADKVGPFHNPSESYPYEYVPICELENANGKRKDLTIGESLEGHSFMSSPKIELQFAKNTPRTKICSMNLDDDKVEELADMIGDNYWALTYIDELPAWNFVGEVDPKTKLPYLYTHRTYKFKKNQDRVIDVDIEPSKPIKVENGTSISLTYSSTWSDTTVPFKKRFHKYLESNFLEHRVHWYSILNSFMLCIFLVAVVAIILLRTLKNDLAKYAQAEADELESLDRDESGWKQVHGDVFRRPSHLMLFSVLYSSGCHLAVMALATVILALANSYYTQRGTTATAAVMSYVLTQAFGGYTGGYIFKLYSGKGWRRAMFYQCFFIPSVAIVIYSFLNTAAILYASSMQISLRNIASLVVLFCAASIPLHVLGTLLGRRKADRTSFPCRVHSLKRPIPNRTFLFLPFLLIVAGLIPFGCVFIEMYFLFSSYWSYKFYYVYGFVLAVMALLTCVLMCVSIVCVYILLNAEDYRWAWVSFLSCSSTAVYVWIYSIYYFFHSTKMTGFLQFVYYFGTTGIFCLSLGVVCGALGYIGSSCFVWRIYKNIKSD